MKDLYLVCVSDYYYKNRIFDPNASAIGENLFYPFYVLRQKLLERNVTINTYDYYRGGKDYALLFFDLPRRITKRLLRQHKDIKKYLVMWEPNLEYSLSRNESLYSKFEKIFTWNDTLADGKKYIKYYFPNKIPDSVNFDLRSKTGFCTLIAGNKASSHPQELYSEREKTIRWFELNHPEDFDLFGVGWDKYCFKGAWSILNNRYLDVVRRVLAPEYPSYKGMVKSKSEILRKYKFSLCYENMRDIPGYVTEKIFDCFFPGCVPVYWGPGNVTETIPRETFVDRSSFASHDELYGYLKNMSDERYSAYLNAIKNFVEGDNIYRFSAQCFTDNLIGQILGV